MSLLCESGGSHCKELSGMCVDAGETGETQSGRALVGGSVSARVAHV